MQSAQPSDDTPEVELVAFPFPFVDEDDQKLRCFIAKYYMNAEIDGTILVENMNHIFQWIKDGRVPAKSKAKPALVKHE